MIDPKLEAWIRKEAPSKIEQYVLKDNKHPIPYCIKYNGSVLKIGGKTSWRTAGYARAAIRSHVLYSMLRSAFVWLNNDYVFTPIGEIVNGNEPYYIKEFILDWVCTNLVKIEPVS